MKITKTNDLLYMPRRCFQDASYLKRYEAYARHIRGIYEASYSLP
jgi:hypothetical protein